MKIRNILPEFKIAGQPDPKDAADYKEKMKTLQQIQNNPRMRDPETQATIAKRKEELRKWAEKNMPKEEILDIDESGIMYRAGVKKYGKEGMRKIQSAAGKGASHQEIGKIKDKYVKDDMQKDDNTDIDIRKLLVDISSMKDRISELAMDDGTKTSALTALGKVEDDIAQEIKGSFPEDADIDAQMKVDILQFLNTKVAGIERQIEMKPAFTQEDMENKEFTLKLIDFVQKKLDDKQKGD